jgi:hypothetical protein
MELWELSPKRQITRTGNILDRIHVHCRQYTVCST